MNNYAKYIDHTILAMDATENEVMQKCEEAKLHHFYSVCVNSCYVPLVSQCLSGTDVKVCSVIGFPLGAMLTDSKAFETKSAIEAGAQEIDMVINVGWLKSGRWQWVEEDIQAVYQAAGSVPLKVIIETCLLTEAEISQVCMLCKKIGVAFVKTSTGFSHSGAKVEDVRLMRQTVGTQLGVKASGGIRDRAAAEAMIKAGASRLGTSGGINIISNSQKDSGKY